MIFSYNTLQSFFKKKLPKAEKLAEILNLHFFEVEELEKRDNDFAIDIDILPNRGTDCFSHIGVAREISALLNLPLKEPEAEVKETEQNAADFVSLKVKSKKDCYRYTARVISDVNVTPSPDRIKDSLKTMGLKPINNIVDIANYVMLEMGQPLHAFDLEKITDKTIIVRRAEKGERITTLDNERYALGGNILVIADSRRPIAIAGIKGGKKTEIDGKTKTIVLEAANFDAKTVRNGSKSIDLKTDASWRFEHGITPNLTESAINRAAFLIQEIAKGKVCKGLVDFYPQGPASKRVKLNIDYVESLLGVKIPASRIKNILKQLGFAILKTSKSELLVGVPDFRLDVEIAEDLIEEIGRIYGYENIESVFPIGSLIPPEKNFDIFWKNKTKDILKEAGFTELYNYSFVSKKQVEMFGYGDSALLELENPLSDNYQYMRPSLVPNILKIYKENQKNFKNIKIFELGKIFLKKRKVEEKRMLTGLMSGDAFYEMKGVTDALLNKLGMSDIWYDEYKPTPEDSKKSMWHPKKIAEIKVGQTEIGFLGEISPAILEQLKINSQVVLFDFDFDKLNRMASEESEFEPISPYPSAVRDIAVLVPKELRVEAVLNRINAIGGALIKDIDLFDIYEGEELPFEKKNLAFHIIYQAKDRTLSSKEIDDMQNKIIKGLDKDPEWEVRK